MVPEGRPVSAAGLGGRSGTEAAIRPDPAIRLRPYRPAHRPWVEAAHLSHYTQVEGFDPSFAAAVAAALDVLEARLADETSQFLIAEAKAAPVGCAFFAAETEEIGRLRLFYLEEAWRGRGLGRQMLDRVLDHARRHGFASLRVSTFDRHEAACRLYRAAGFREAVGEPSIAFGQRMRQIDFEMRMADRS